LGASAGITVRSKAANSSEETWRKDIVTYSYSKGAFLGLDLNGATVRKDRDAMSALYGTSTTGTTDQVLKDKVPVPSQGRGFVAEAARVENGKIG
jgi:lipid-binding SYLF domain-containing protein